MVERWEYADRDYVFACGREVSANEQRCERHSCIDSGASRSACHSGRMSELTARGTAPTLISSVGSAIEQCGYKKVHWRKRDLVGETKRIGFMIESNGKSFTFHLFG